MSETEYHDDAPIENQQSSTNIDKPSVVVDDKNKLVQSLLPIGVVVAGALALLFVNFGTGSEKVTEIEVEQEPKFERAIGQIELPEIVEEVEEVEEPITIRAQSIPVDNTAQNQLEMERERRLTEQMRIRESARAAQIAAHDARLSERLQLAHEQKLKKEEAKAERARLIVEQRQKEQDRLDAIKAQEQKEIEEQIAKDEAAQKQKQEQLMKRLAADTDVTGSGLSLGSSKGSVSTLGSNSDTSNKLSSSGANSPGGLDVGIAQRTGSNKARYVSEEERDFTLPKGFIINASLNTRIVSDLPGVITAVVNRDIYSSTGRYKLLEKGSKLTGSYKSGLKRGQARLFVIWDEVKSPNGITLNLNSAGTGALGAAGIGGWINRHYAQRFGASVLLSVVGGFVAREASKDIESSSSAQIVSQSTLESFSSIAEATLKDSIGIKDTLHANQGAKVAVIVAQDIDFKDALTQIPSKNDDIDRTTSYSNFTGNR